MLHHFLGDRRSCRDEGSGDNRSGFGHSQTPPREKTFVVRTSFDLKLSEPEGWTIRTNLRLRLVFDAYSQAHARTLVRLCRPMKYAAEAPGALNRLPISPVRTMAHRTSITIRTISKTKPIPPPIYILNSSGCPRSQEAGTRNASKHPSAALSVRCRTNRHIGRRFESTLTA